MTLKEQNIILDRLNKLQSTVDYNNDLYRDMLFGVRGIAIELGLVGED